MSSDGPRSSRKARSIPSSGPCPRAQLTQTFYWATREDGMRMDKFAFGRQGSWYTVNDLDTGGPATGIAPPTPPPVPPAYTRVGEPLATGYEPKFLGSAHSPRKFAEFRCVLEPGDAGKRRQVGQRRSSRVTSTNWTQARAASRTGACQRPRSSSGTCCSGAISSRNGCRTCRRQKQLEEIHEWLAAIAASSRISSRSKWSTSRCMIRRTRRRRATRPQRRLAVATTKRWAAPARPAGTGSSTRSRWRGSTSPTPS